MQAPCRQRAAHDVTSNFCGTGSVSIKDGGRYRTPKRLQAGQACGSGMRHPGRPMARCLTDPLGLPIPPGELHEPRFRGKCRLCGRRLTCNGRSNCGSCGPRADRLPTAAELEGAEG